MWAPAESRQVIGRYLLCDALASGGMGTVHLARTEVDSGTSIFAAKRLHPHLRNDKELAVMLLDEARLAVSIHHPNVVQVVDVVSTPTDVLLVMEFVLGVSVSELVADGSSGRVAAPLGVALTIMIDALHGLQAAHEAVGDDGKPLHLVHRDVSPQNLLVEAQTGTTKLTDFGVAKAVGRLRSTHDGAIRGKIAYMSPEHVAGEALDSRTDVYSAAVVLWELIAGRAMFSAESDVGLFAKAMRGPTERLSEVVPAVPPALDAAVWRALARDPRRRYPSARAFADALEAAYGPSDHGAVAAWLHERASDVLASRTATVEQILAEDTSDPSWRFTGPPPPPTVVTPSSFAVLSDGDTLTLGRAEPRRKRQELGFALAGMTLAFVLGAVYIVQRRPSPPPQTMAGTTSVAPPPQLPAAAVIAKPPASSETAASEPQSSAQPAASPTPSAKPRGRSAAGRKTDKDPKADCNPPYTQDEAGKHFKPWCLH